MARIRIDIDDLTTAISDHDNKWVLDLETGEVLIREWVRDPGMRADMGLVLDGDPGDEDDEDDLDPLESGRFRGIGSVPSHDGFLWMERFADDQEARVRDRLADALDRPRPFRRFRDALEEFPAVREAWYRYEEQRLREEAESWLRAEGIDAELVGNHPAGSAGERGPIGR